MLIFSMPSTGSMKKDTVLRVNIISIKMMNMKKNMNSLMSTMRVVRVKNMADSTKNMKGIRWVEMIVELLNFFKKLDLSK